MALLHRPEAAAARLELETCEGLGISPSQFRGRPTVATYIYDEAGRVAKVVQSSPWTEEDRALMIAWRVYQDGLCKGCGHPRATAWHPDNGLGAFELVDEVTCWGCTAAQKPREDGTIEEVTYPVIEDVRDYDVYPLPLQAD